MRKEIDEEYERLKTRLERLRAYRQALDGVIGVRSFATADAALGTAGTGLGTAQTGPSTEATSTTPPETPKTIELYNKSRSLLLATINIEDGSLRVTPAEHALYDIKRGAFARFFVQRILGKFQEEDRHRVENGEIEWDDAFDFEVKSEDGHLTEIIIKNYGTNERLQEIQRALRWALEKTYSKR